MSKVVFGTKRHIEYNAPELKSYANVSRNESLIFFDSRIGKSNERMCLGVGRVTHITKGDGMDIVYINFGRNYGRKIIVVNNHARRQVYTLKRGQLATFYGIAKIYQEDNKKKMGLFATGFNAWYVPKALDIKNYDSDDIEELTQEEETQTNDFIKNLFEGEE